MDSVSFKNALMLAKPPLQTLVMAGLSRTEALEFGLSFEVNPRAVAEPSALPDFTLADLFSRYDVSRVEIGMLQFYGHPETVADGWLIGDVEADLLVLDKQSGEIIVKDFTSPDHIIWKCAQDGSHLLAALAHAAKYLGGCLSEDKTGTLEQKNAIGYCITLAGGRSYFSFFEMLLGLE